MLTYSTALARRISRRPNRVGVIEVRAAHNGKLLSRLMIPLARTPWYLVMLCAIARWWGGLGQWGALSFSTAFANKVLDAFGNAGAGFNFDSGVLEIRSGAAPGPDAADAGTLGASITLPADAFNAGAAKSMTKAGTWQDASADAAITAAHFRVKQSGDTGGATGSTDERIEGTISGTGGGGDMELDNTSIAAGQQVTISTFTWSLP